MVGNCRNLSVLACRVCLSMEENKVIMDTENGWLELFEYCFGLLIHPREQARALCEQCALGIKNFALLKVKCLESDSIWKANLKTHQLHMQLRKDGLTGNTDSEDNLNEFKEDIIEISDETDAKDIFEQKEKKRVADKKENFNFSIKFYEEHDYDDNVQVSTEHEFKEIMKCSDNNESIEKSDNSQSDINSIEPETKNISDARIKMPYEREIPARKPGENRKFYLKKTLVARNFYKCEENRNDVLKNCGICDFTTKEVRTLCQHFNEHFKQNSLECQLCDYIGLDFAEMVYHRYTHVPIEHPALNCLTCLKRFGTPIGLQFHFRRVHLKKKKAGICTICNLTFSSIRSWKMHNILHVDSSEVAIENLFICDCCGRRFKWRCKLVEHLQIRAGMKRVKCDQCGEVYTQQKNLNSHIKNMHGTEAEKVKCPQCPKIVKQCNLKNHIDRIHGDKIYTCEVCSASYTTKESLRTHILDHTKQRPYKCDLCEATYKTKRVLTMHRKRHWGEKSYVCSLCTKSFITPRELRIHNSVHTKVRMYKCNHCSKTFNEKKRLKVHCDKTHPELNITAES